jgi:hypothetical protein
MQFFAIQLQCHRCSKRFLVGGGAQSDIAMWLEREVVCPACDAPIEAREGTAVPLGNPQVDAQEFRR